MRPAGPAADSGSLDKSCPSCDLAARIEKAAKKHPPPFFVLVYGGLQAFGGVETASPLNFFTLQSDAVERLGSEFVTVGASDEEDEEESDEPIYDLEGNEVELPKGAGKGSNE